MDNERIVAQRYRTAGMVSITFAIAVLILAIIFSIATTTG